MRHDGRDTAKAPEEIALEHTRSAWRAVPTRLTDFHDPLHADIRAQRDAYWDKMSGALYPLPGPPQGVMGVPHADYVSKLPTAQDSPGSTWVVAVFESANSILTRSERSIYTEMRLRVEKVVCRSAPEPGEYVDLGTFGGSVILPSGERLNYQLGADEFDLEPNHRYLLMLSPVMPGNFYLNFNSWEIEGGILRANSYTSVYGRRAKNLPLDKDTEEDALAKLKTVCSQRMKPS